MLNQHYAVEYGNTKEGNETHSGRYAEGQATQPQQYHAPYGGQGDGGEDHEGVFHRFKGKMQEDENQEEGHGDCYEQAIGRIFKVLELAAIGNVGAGLQLYVGVDAA